MRQHGRRRRSGIRILGGVLALALTASCTVAERQVAQQDSRIDTLQDRLLRVERAMEESRSGAGAGAAPTVPSDLGARLADLGQQVAALDAEVRSLAGRLDALSRKTGQAAPESPRLQDLESRLAALGERLDRLATKEAGPSSAVSPPPAAPSAPPTPAAPTARTDRLPPQALYDKAYGLYKAGKYEEAREAFRQYEELYPDTKLTDNAYFWTGESYYDQGQYEQAILEYDKVVQKFPAGDKVASALLKQAFAFDAIGDPVDARILLKKILREHPTSEQATIAKKKLEILGE